MDNEWKDKYDKFIMKMLREIHMNSKKDKSKSNKKNQLLDSNEKLQNNDRNKPKNNIDSKYELNSQLVEITQKTTPSEQMLEIFKQAILDCYIVDFINSDPTKSIIQDYVDGVECFEKIIKEKVQRPFIHNQKEPLYLKISEFTKALDEYADYLAFHMRPLDENVDIFVPLYREENTKWALEFARETIKQRSLINYLYGEVCDGDTLFVY